MTSPEIFSTQVPIAYNTGKKTRNKWQYMKFMENTYKIENFNVRSWLARHGKHQFVDFDPVQRKEMKQIF